jgi:hypothetical protein
VPVTMTSCKVLPGAVVSVCAVVVVAGACCARAALAAMANATAAAMDALCSVFVELNDM